MKQTALERLRTRVPGTALGATLVFLMARHLFAIVYLNKLARRALAGSMDTGDGGKDTPWAG